MSTRHEGSRRHRSRSRSPERARDRSGERRKRSGQHRERSRDRRDRSGEKRVRSGEKRVRSHEPRNPSRERRKHSDERHEVSRERRELSKPHSTDGKDHEKRSDSTTKERSRSKHKKSKKKKKKRSSSSSSSSSSGSVSSVASAEEELKLLQRLQSERERIAEERRNEKEAMKAKETPEEKRARRLREKQAKERRRRGRMGWDTEYQGYTDQDNPFGDSALTHSFVWGKKLAREGVRHVSRDQLDASARQKQLENKIELEKVKQRRLEREAERAAREAEAAAAARAREAAQFSSWARQEDAFHLQQARLRSEIRIRDGRAKPIDLLAWYVSSEQCADALEMHEPYTYLNGLGEADLEDLLADIEVYRTLPGDQRDQRDQEQAERRDQQEYWDDVHTIALDERDKLRRLTAPAAARRAVHHAVANDVTQIFKGKTGAQLAALQQQIERKISGRRDGVDVGYWESLLSQLKAHMARARLRDRHQLNLRRKLQLLKREQGVAPETTSKSRSPSPSPAPREDARGQDGDEDEDEDANTEALSAAAYERGRYSPEPLAPADLEPGAMPLAPHEDSARLAYLRARLRLQHAGQEGAGVAAGGSAAPGGSTLQAAAERAMGPAAASDAPFSNEMPVAALPLPLAQDAPQLWPDKYRPRKPRYFNRVHTGFEWNKYNQTHYDMDNPPPKIVQGYKFNIFYPDLIDKRATPSFTLKVCADNPEFAVLRFHAGPPYEDIAFKIVNREWEYSYKRGFRCHFHNNIFQLWFHFKRYRYRR